MIRAVAMEKRLRLNAGKFPHSEAEQTARNRVVFALIACIIVQLWQKKHVFLLQRDLLSSACRVFPLRIVNWHRIVKMLASIPKRHGKSHSHRKT